MKNPLNSKTIWGLIILVLNFVAGAFGFELDFNWLGDGVTAQELFDFLGAVLVILGVRYGDKELSFKAPFKLFGGKDE